MAQELQMPGVSKAETFWLTWKVENVHLSNRTMGKCFATQIFQVGILQNTMWQLMFAPAGINDPLYMGCSLGRMSTARERDEPEVIKLSWKIGIIAERGTVRFEACEVNSFFKRKEFRDMPHFIRRSELLPTDTPQNNLTIYCQITNDPIFSLSQDLKYDLEALSSDLTGLLESGFRSDFTMNCRGEIFNVHKFILLSRWPKFCKRFEIDDIKTSHGVFITAIEASTLKAFLTFLYSGKLQRKDISMELCTYMHEQFCDVLMVSLNTPVSNIEFVTHMHHEWKYLTWEVGDEPSFAPFFRVIPLEEVYPSEMVINFSFEKRDGEEWLKLGTILTSFNPLRPLLLDGEISFINKGSVVSSRKFNYLVQTGDAWYFPQHVKKRDLFPNERNNKSIEICLCICDGNESTRQVTANINNASSFQEVKDLRKLMMDLVNSPYEKDIKLKIGDSLHDVHSLMLAARSKEFRKLVEDNDGIIEIKEHMGKEASDSLIRHLYGESLLDLDATNLISLYCVAIKFSLSSLEEKTRRMLEE